MASGQRIPCFKEDICFFIFFKTKLPTRKMKEYKGTQKGNPRRESQVTHYKKGLQRGYLFSISCTLMPDVSVL